MKLATWNVNSIRSRLDRVVDWLSRQTPDVLCLQELKCTEAQFPFEPIEATGYHAAVFGQKTYNGVAILSRTEPTDIRRGFQDGEADEPARFIAAEIDGVRIASYYTPNGRTMESEQFDYKLQWLSRLRTVLERDYATDKPLVICGDSNLILHDDDAADMEAWRTSVLGCDAVRDAWKQVIDWGLCDVFRSFHPEGGVFSWWDYRRLAFPRNDGLRLDHVFATEPLTKTAAAATADRDERKKSPLGLPSDHVPVVVTFEP